MYTFKNQNFWKILLDSFYCCPKAPNTIRVPFNKKVDKWRHAILPICRHADWADLSSLGSCISFQAHSSDFETPQDNRYQNRDVFRILSNTFTFMSHCFCLLFTWRTRLLCWINKILMSICEIPERSASRPSFYHVISHKMLAPRPDSSTAQSTWRYTRQVLWFKNDSHD